MLKNRAWIQLAWGQVLHALEANFWGMALFVTVALHVLQYFMKIFLRTAKILGQNGQKYYN